MLERPMIALALARWTDFPTKPKKLKKVKLTTKLKKIRIQKA